jgi:hypothetical protein
VYQQQDERAQKWAFQIKNAPAFSKFFGIKAVKLTINGARLAVLTAVLL